MILRSNSAILKKYVAFGTKKPMVAAEAEILNPAFDCTPRDFVTGYITEKGILAPPFTKEMFV